MIQNQFKTDDWSERIIYSDGCRHSYSCLESLITLMDTDKDDRVVFWHKLYSIRYCLVSDIQYSVFYRNLIQKNSLDDIMVLLCHEAPSLEKYVDLDLLRQTISYYKEDMGDIDIIRLPVSATLIIDGNVYKGLAGLEKACFDSATDVHLRRMFYPHFDEYDMAYDNRYYGNFYFCKENSAKDEKINELVQHEMNFCLIDEHMPKDILPIVYVNGDQPTMLFASE